MRRTGVVVISAALVAALGCGRRNYEERMTKTIDKIRYDMRVNKNLDKPVDDKRFADLKIFLRPPKDAPAAKQSQIAVAEGQFDLDQGFVGKDGSTLDVLARVKQPKKPATKGAPPPSPGPARGDFNAELVSTLAGAFGAADNLAVTKFKDETRRGNRFKRLLYNANERDIEVWTLKQDNHDVALIFTYDPKLKASLASKIQLCLETFAVGAKADRNRNGEVAEEDPGASIPL